MTADAGTPTPPGATACIALADGTLIFGRGFGAEGVAVGELCFNTAMTGYQEIMTDPSYAGQIVTFTFPHVGNVGTNPEDDETSEPVARGMVVKWDVTDPSNWRAADHLSQWLARRGRIGVSGVTSGVYRLIQACQMTAQPETTAVTNFIAGPRRAIGAILARWPCLRCLRRNGKAGAEDKGRDEQTETNRDQFPFHRCSPPSEDILDTSPSSPYR